MCFHFMYQSLQHMMAPVSRYFVLSSGRLFSAKANSKHVVQRIQQCLHSRRKHIHKNNRCKYGDLKSARQIVAIYNTARYPADAVILNQMLRACSFLSDSETTELLLDVIWNPLLNSPSDNLNIILLLQLLLHHHDAFMKLPQIMEWVLNSDADLSGSNISDLRSIFKLLNHYIYHQSLLDLYWKSEIYSDYELNNEALRASIASNNETAGREIIDVSNGSICLESIIGFFSHFDDITGALNAFTSMKETQAMTTSSVTIGKLMKLLIAHSRYKDAVSIYHQSGHLHNDILHSLALTAYSHIGDYQNGTALHHQLELKSEYSSNIRLHHSLMHFYAKFDDIESVKNVFNSIPLELRTPKCLGVIIQILIDHGLYSDALAVYDDHHSLKDNISHLLAIRACTESRDWSKGRSIHKAIGDQLKEISGSNIQLVTTLIDFYGTSGDIEAAKFLFESIGSESMNIVAIGSMMKAMLECECYAQCIELFDDIPTKYGLNPNEICYDIVLDACTQHTAYHIGRRIHEQLKATEDGRRIASEIEIQTNLINLYGKSGMMTECEEISKDTGSVQDIRICNAMITAYGRNGLLDRALEYFQTAQNDENLMNCDRNTFIAIVNACSHSGESDVAYEVWETIDDAAIKYDSYVVSAVVDCLARKGKIEKGHEVVQEYERCRKKSDENDHNIWIALLSGAKKAKNFATIETVYQNVMDRFSDNCSVIGRATALITLHHTTSRFRETGADLF